MNADTTLRAEELHERAAQYQALASFFLDLPNRASLDAMKDQLRDGQEDSSAGVRELSKFFATASNDERTLIDVGADRTFLLRGTTRQGPRPPYGSLHAGADPSASMLELKALYRKAGFSLSSDIHEAPDYLGIELAFMAALLERAASLETKEAMRLVGLGDEALGRFVIPLVRSYCAEALGFARTGYARGLLLLCEEFVEAEAKSLASRLEPPYSRERDT